MNLERYWFFFYTNSVSKKGTRNTLFGGQWNTHVKTRSQNLSHNFVLLFVQIIIGKVIWGPLVTVGVNEIENKRKRDIIDISGNLRL